MIWISKCWGRLGLWSVLTVGLLVGLAEPVSAAPAVDGGATTPASSGVPDDIAEVDWFEEMLEGGMTMVFLGLLSVGLVAFSFERLWSLRERRFVPAGLVDKVLPLFHLRRYDEIRELCDQNPSTLAEVIRFLVDHRKADPQSLAAGAGDIGARDVVDQEQKTYPLAVIASLAPLLGLLGTMIGMIESFKLVEVFGDEGGASLLAGSISKALITTAVGLIIAIPGLVLYHFFKHRAHSISNRLERSAERLINSWFLTPRADALAAIKQGEARADHAPVDEEQNASEQLAVMAGPSPSA